MDVNLPNSYEQTALDIVHKFTRKAGAKELKKLLQGEIESVAVVAALCPREDNYQLITGLNRVPCPSYALHSWLQ